MIDTIKKMLKESGCPVELVEIIGNQFATEIGRVTVPKKEFNMKAQLARNLQDQLRQKEDEIKSFEKAAALTDSLSKQLADLQNKYDTETRELKANIEILALNHVLDLKLLKVKEKNMNTISSLYNQLNRLLTTDIHVIYSSSKTIEAHRKKWNYRRKRFFEF